MKKAIFCGLVPGALFAANLLTDGDFERTAAGEKTGWRTSTQVGWFHAPGEGVDGSAAIGVVDDGTNNCKWLSPPVKLQPNRLYGFAAQVKAARGEEQ